MKPVAGEVVFTAMTGYPESLTDPSYAGQLMTWHIRWLVIMGASVTFRTQWLGHFMEVNVSMPKRLCKWLQWKFSHWNAKRKSGWLAEAWTNSGHYGIDTRELTKVCCANTVWWWGKSYLMMNPEKVRKQRIRNYQLCGDKVSCTRKWFVTTKVPGKEKVVLVDVV